jgi:hypothetical protein
LASRGSGASQRCARRDRLNAFESAREIAAFAVDALDALGGLQ